MDYIKLAQELGLDKEANRRCDEAKKGNVKTPIISNMKIYKDIFSKKIKSNEAEIERGVSDGLVIKYQQENIQLRKAIDHIEAHIDCEWKE